MNPRHRRSAKLQTIVYALEVAVLAGMFTLAAAGSPEFALGPLARLLAAAALPLPCHLLLVAHFVWTGREQRRRARVPALRWAPAPVPA